jgi:hypothetical protein
MDFFLHKPQTPSYICRRRLRAPRAQAPNPVKVKHTNSLLTSPVHTIRSAAVFPTLSRALCRRRACKLGKVATNAAALNSAMVNLTPTHKPTHNKAQQPTTSKAPKKVKILKGATTPTSTGQGEHKDIGKYARYALDRLGKHWTYSYTPFMCAPMTNKPTEPTQTSQDDVQSVHTVERSPSPPPRKQRKQNKQKAAGAFHDDDGTPGTGRDFGGGRRGLGPVWYAFSGCA